MSRRFEQEYSRANDRIHPRKDLKQELEQKWAAEEAREARTRRRAGAFPAWARYAALAAGILLCIGLGMESMVLFGRSRGMENKSASAEAPALAQDMAQGAVVASETAERAEEPILYEAPAEDMDLEAAAPVPETMLMATATYEPPQGTHLAQNEAEVEDAVLYGMADGGEGYYAAAPNERKETQKAAVTLSVTGGARGELVQRGDLYAVFLPTTEQIHVIRFDGRKVESVFSLTLRERQMRVQKVLWLGNEFLALRERDGDTELLRFGVADWKSPRHLANLTQSGRFLTAAEIGGQAVILSLYQATAEEPLPWADGARVDFDRVLLDQARPGDTFTVLSVYGPGGDGFAETVALLARAEGAVTAQDRLLLWTDGGDLYAFALTEAGLTLTAERAGTGTVLSAQATAAGYSLLLQAGETVTFLTLDEDLNETATTTARPGSDLGSAQAYADMGLFLTADALHVLTAAGDRSLPLSGDGFRRLTEDWVLVLSQEGLLQLVSLTGAGLEPLGTVQVRGGLGALLDDLSRMDYDPATGRLVIPAGKNVMPYIIDGGGKITLRGETQTFNDQDETAQLELRVVLLENQALVFHKVGVVLCNQYLARLSNTKY